LDAMTAAQLDNWLYTAWTKVNFNSINTAQMFFEREDFLRMVDLLLKSHLYGDKISYSDQITINMVLEAFLSDTNIENTNTEEIIIENTNTENIIIEDTNSGNIIVEDLEEIIIEDTNSGNTFFNKLVEKPSSTIFGSLYSNPLFDSSKFLKKEGILDIYDQYKYLKETTVFNNKYICYGGQLWVRDLLNQQYFQRDAVIAGYIIRDSLLDFEALEYRFW